MNNNLIIFGAGASIGEHGASFFNQNGVYIEKSPPLGNKLFYELRQFNSAGWGKIAAQHAKLFENDFEAGMHDIAHNGSYDLAFLQRNMAAFFFNFVPGTNGMYVHLANKIKASNWHGSIVTLNYERLLAKSLQHVGVNAVCGEKPKESNTIELCFPHGCCDLFCDSIQAQGNIQFGIGISTSGSIRIISEPTEYFRRLNSDRIPPVMSYFEPNKRTLAGINFIDEQRQRYADLISSAKTIAIIGMRYREQDKHLWDPLKSTKARLIYCSGKNISMFSEWQRKHRPEKSDLVLAQYFSDGFDEICKQLGMK